MKLFWQDVATVQVLTGSLLKNEVSITTTDTIPGFLVNTTQQGFENLNKIKNSRQDKPYIVLVSDISKLRHFLGEQVVAPEIDKILRSCWPGPLTGIFKAGANIPEFLKSKNGTIALRCPNHPGLLNLLQNFNGLFSTSANISGYESAKSIDDVDPRLIPLVKFLVDDHQPNLKFEPSTILDFSSFESTKQIFLIRHGAYSVSEIEKIGGIKIINI